MPAHKLQLPLGIKLRDTASFASFVAGANAELAAQLQRFPAQIYMHGAGGSGKSHLLQALCRAADAVGRTTAYLPLRELQDVPMFLQGMAEIDVICVDDCESIAGQREAEVALMALCDAARSGGRCLVLAGRNPPGELGLTLRDLSSRLGWGGVYALKPLSEADKQQALQRRARARGLELEEDVAQYLLRRTARDLPSLLELLDQLDTASLAQRRRLTIPMVREALQASVPAV
ncbi:MAG: DnaA regulatory inactivator Hda [Nevskiales bacterium]